MSKTNSPNTCPRMHSLPNRGKPHGNERALPDKTHPDRRHWRQTGPALQNSHCISPAHTESNTKIIPHGTENWLYLNIKYLANKPYSMYNIINT